MSMSVKHLTSSQLSQLLQNKGITPPANNPTQQSLVNLAAANGIFVRPSRSPRTGHERSAHPVLSSTCPPAASTSAAFALVRVLSRRHEHLLTKAFGEWQRWMVQEEALGATFVSLQARYEENFRLQASLDALQQQCLADKSAAGPSSSERERDLLAQLEASKAKSEQLEKSLRAAEDLSRERGVSLDLSDGRVSRLESQLSDAEKAHADAMATATSKHANELRALQDAKAALQREAAERAEVSADATRDAVARARAEAEASAVEAEKEKEVAVARARTEAREAAEALAKESAANAARAHADALSAASRKADEKSSALEMELSSARSELTAVKEELRSLTRQKEAEIAATLERSKHNAAVEVGAAAEHLNAAVKAGKEAREQSRVRALKSLLSNAHRAELASTWRSWHRNASLQMAERQIATEKQFAASATRIAIEAAVAEAVAAASKEHAKAVEEVTREAQRAAKAEAAAEAALAESQRRRNSSSRTTVEAEGGASPLPSLVAAREAHGAGNSHPALILHTRLRDAACSEVARLLCSLIAVQASRRAFTRRRVEVASVRRYLTLPDKPLLALAFLISSSPVSAGQSVAVVASQRRLQWLGGALVSRLRTPFATGGVGLFTHARREPQSGAQRG